MQVDIEDQVKTAAIATNDDSLRKLMFGPDKLFEALARKEGDSAAQLRDQLTKRLSLTRSESEVLLDDKFTEVVRTTVRHENDLVNHRITWLILFNGFAMSYLSANPASVDSQWWREVTCEAIAIPICVSAGFSLALAGVAIRKQIEAFSRKFPGIACDTPGSGILGARLDFGSSLFPRLVIPAFVLAIWLLRLLKTTTTLKDQSVTMLAAAAAVAAFLFWRQWEICLGKEAS